MMQSHSFTMPGFTSTVMAVIRILMSLLNGIRKLLKMVKGEHGTIWAICLQKDRDVK